MADTATARHHMVLKTDPLQGIWELLTHTYMHAHKYTAAVGS